MPLWRHLWWKELLSTSEEIFKEEKFFIQHDVQNEKLRKKKEKLRKKKEQLRKENEPLRKNNIVKYVEIKESIERPKGIKFWRR